MIDAKYIDFLKPSFFPDSRRIAFLSASEKRVSIWDIMSGKQVSSLTLHEGGDHLAMSPNGDHVVLGFSNRVIRVLNAIP